MEALVNLIRILMMNHRQVRCLSLKKKRKRDSNKNITPGTDPGAHAEVHALNKALNARNDAEISDMICCVVETGMGKNKSTRIGNYMPRCPHCEYITNGVGYFPEPLWYGKESGRAYGDYEK